jgi:hypothetical protein
MKSIEMHYSRRVCVQNENSHTFDRADKMSREQDGPVSVSNKADYDSPWKKALEVYFEEFIDFFFPEMAADVDWSREHVFLDKELQQVAREAALGRRYVDKLVRVYRKNGHEEWVLAHIEVQGQPDIDFPMRMYTYNYRIFDRFNRKVASLAILADENS